MLSPCTIFALILEPDTSRYSFLYVLDVLILTAFHKAFLSCLKVRLCTSIVLLRDIISEGIRSTSTFSMHQLSEVTTG